MKRIAFSAIALIVVGAMVIFLFKGKDLTRKSHQLDLIVFSVLKDLNVKPRALIKERYAKASCGRIYPARILRVTKEYRIPPSLPQWTVQNKLERAIRGRGFVLSQSDFAYGRTERLSTFTFCYKKFPIYTLILRQRPAAEAKSAKVQAPEPFALYKKKAKVAIVIDDWGYSRNNLELLWQIKRPLTLAILPNLSYSREIASLARKKGYEIILHLPMEAKDPSAKPEADTIQTSMSEMEILSNLSDALSSVPHAKGVSGHQGSKATENAEVMSVLLGELKRRRIFFLDSFSTPDSVCEALARKNGLRFARRDVFLDNSDDPLEIREKLYELAADALKNGYAIGIGHDREATLEVIKEALPELEKGGVEFVHLSALVK